MWDQRGRGRQWARGPLQGAEVTCFPPHRQGDSGGPLVCDKGRVAGVLSFSSKSCTDIFKPPVATAVAPYVSWIKKTISTGRPAGPAGDLQL